jgi:putative DNA modification/repair radical SAM protein
MDLLQKLEILADAAKYDASCASSGSKRERPASGIGNATGVGICHSYTPDGRCVSLLKILLTNYCIFDCLFCINRISSNVKRARFTPEEVIDLTLSFYKRNYIEGLFLSSGIIQDPDYTMEQLIRVAQTLRQTHQFGGYIHLKAIPGASADLLKKAGLYADRLSVNIELPRQQDLNKLAPAKSHAVIESSMQTIASDIEQSKEEKLVFAPAGQSTQLIVGATEASDSDIIKKAISLYANHGLRRIYYSAFSPIPDPAAGVPIQNTPKIREHRLYQADWLYRNYHFTEKELLPIGIANFDQRLDPKTIIALNRRQDFPIDVNIASFEELIRVPGLGLKSAKKILQSRRFRRLTLENLRLLGVKLSRSKFFVKTLDHNLALLKLDSKQLTSLLINQNSQLGLFSDEQSVITGEL